MRTKHINKTIIENEEKSETNIIIGEGLDFERTRRITGYLVGTVDRFCDGKRKEEQDRVKHSCCK